MLVLDCENYFCKCDNEPVLIYEARCSVTDNYLFSVYCHKECVKEVEEELGVVLLPV